MKRMQAFVVAAMFALGLVAMAERHPYCELLTPDNWILWWYYGCHQDAGGGGGSGAGN